MANNFVYIGLCLLAYAVLKQKCEAAGIHSATSAVDTFIEDSFPRDTDFNETCVAEGCPALKNIGLCQNGLDINALKNIITTIHKCMRRPICGKVMDPLPLRSLGLSTDELLPGEKIHGILQLIPGTNYVSNISNIHLETVSNQSQSSPLQLILLIPNVIAYGRVQLDFSLSTGLGQALNANLKGATFTLELQFMSVLTINQTGPNSDIIFVSPSVKAHHQLGGFEMPLGFPDITTLLSATIQIIVERSSMANATATYLGKLYQTAINVVTNNCKSLNNAN